MKKLFLLGTMLGMASAALAFGGIFNHGSKSSTYKGGVDAIGVHFGGEKKTADIPSCPEHSAWNGTSCECKLGWLTNESGECTCPEERTCGDTCCGEGNVCNQETHQCCFEPYQSYLEHGWIENIDSVCCNADESLGISDGEDPEGCCPFGSIPYISYKDGEDFLVTHCCYGIAVRDGGSDEDGWYSQKCCPATSTSVNDFGECCGGDNVEWEDGEGNLRCHAKDAYCSEWYSGDSSCYGWSVCNPNKVLKPLDNRISACCNEDQEVYCSRGDWSTQKCINAGCCLAGETCETIWEH